MVWLNRNSTEARRIRLAGAEAGGDFHTHRDEARDRHGVGWTRSPPSRRANSSWRATRSTHEPNKYPMRDEG